MNKVFAYGEIGVDNIIQVPFLPTPEKAVFPTGDSYHIGGASANLAVLLASWDIGVALAGNAIGDDLYGGQLSEWLKAYPVLDTSRLSIQSGLDTPFCRILVTPDGERSIIVYKYPQTPKTTLTEEMLKGVRVLALDLYGGSERIEAARLGREMGVTTIAGDVIWTDHAVLPHTDIIINSAAFIHQVFPEQDVLSKSMQIHEITGGAVITTNGSHPVHVIPTEGKSFWVQPPHVKALDTTGAGDAFMAGFIYGLLQDWELPRCVQWASAVGALKVGRLGAVSKPPSVDEINTLAKTISS